MLNIPMIIGEAFHALADHLNHDQITPILHEAADKITEAAGALSSDLTAVAELGKHAADETTPAPVPTTAPVYSTETKTSGPF
jgi:hypothetical protein